MHNSGILVLPIDYFKAYTCHFCIDPDEYLPETTLERYSSQVDLIEIRVRISLGMNHDDGMPLYKITYLYLREMGNNFITREADLALRANISKKMSSPWCLMLLSFLFCANHD